MKTITLDFDDFSIENNNLYYIDRLRELYPNFKVSMFYIPADAVYFNRLMPEMKEEAKKLVRTGVADGWLELIPHGVTHIPREFEKATYNDMEMAINAYEEHFNELGVPFVKGFKAPYWLMSDQAVKCLDDHGWFLATDRNQPKAKQAQKNYIYNWDIADPFPSELHEIRGHGHISLPSHNNLPDCIPNLSKISPEYEWKFISEIVKEI